MHNGSVPQQNQTSYRVRFASRVAFKSIDQGDKMAKPTKATGKKDRFSVQDVLGTPTQAAADGSTLGHAAAVNIVCHCAGTSPLNLSQTLSALGVNGIPFQMCVFGSVSYLGYDVNVSDIPDGPSDTLISVVDAIQNAPAKG
jgi:hypothetical protein